MTRAVARGQVDEGRYGHTHDIFEEGHGMNAPLRGTLLRIFIGESDRHGGKPLYEALVLRARERRLAGATVLRGIIGFGKTSHIHSARLETLSTDLPVVIEIVDTAEKINAFLPEVDDLVKEGLVTLEEVTVLKYAAAGPGAPPEPPQ